MSESLAMSGAANLSSRCGSMTAAIFGGLIIAIVDRRDANFRAPRIIKHSSGYQQLIRGRLHGRLVEIKS